MLRAFRVSHSRSALALALLALAACHGPDDRTAAPAASRSGAEHVACALQGAAMAPACTIERTKTDQGLMLTLTGPDGGFRRLRVTTDGRGVVAADGAEPARVTIVGPAEIEVAIGGDRYRLPATVAKAGR